MRTLLFLPLLALFGTVQTVPAQDLFDNDLFRPFSLTFKQPDFWTQLLNNQVSETYIPVDLEVDGVTYPDVGIRMRGQSTIWCAQNNKFPFRLRMDEFVPGQEIYGQDTFRLNNAALDPTFLREALAAEALREYVPMANRGFTNLSINGQNWGVYIIEQQKDGRYAKEFFGTSSGSRYKAIYPAGLRYHGPDPLNYVGRYDHVNGPTSESYLDLIVLLDALNNTPLGKPLLDALAPLIDMDAYLWTLAGNALLCNWDSYQSNTHNYYMLFDGGQQRFYLQTHDLDLTFGTNRPWPNYPITAGFNKFTRPLSARPWKHLPFRQEFWNHIKTLAEDTFSWEHLGPLAWKWHNMIDAAVAADPKRIFSYQAFKDGITKDVSTSGACINYFPGIQRWVEERQAFVLSTDTLLNPRVDLSDVNLNPAAPAQGVPVVVSVTCRSPGKAAKVSLRYRAGPGAFQSIAMRDNGKSGDGAAGDDVYGAQIPGQSAGTLVEYVIVGNRKDPGRGNMSFLPRKSEQEPFEYKVPFGDTGIRITEYMYSGTDGEVLELTNTSSVSIDMTGWSLDDQSATPGVFDLSGAGIVAAGASVVVTDGDAANFSTTWSLVGVTVLGDNTVAKLGRNDAIHLFDATGVLKDRLIYGDEDFPGAPRTQNVSAWICSGGVGMDDPTLWTVSELGDSQGSWFSAGGDVGSPGIWTALDCQ
jgi:hypothetical protein